MKNIIDDFFSNPVPYLILGWNIIKYILDALRANTFFSSKSDKPPKLKNMAGKKGRSIKNTT